MPGSGQTGEVDARSALFDLYGDHLRSRGSRAPVAALVRMLSALSISAPAVRTAVSRMSRQGWLDAVRLPEGAGYALTSRAARRLDQAAERVYRHGKQPDWDGRWHLLVAERIRERARRERLRAGLEYLGYAPIGETSWLSPRPSVEIEVLLETERVRAERFQASYDGDARGLAARTWDLDGLAHAYQRWLAVATELVAPVGPKTPDEVVFAARSTLVHEWRKFLFRDPWLPAELLPGDWTGSRAADLFFTLRERLEEPARAYVRAITSG